MNKLLLSLTLVSSALLAAPMDPGKTCCKTGKVPCCAVDCCKTTDHCCKDMPHKDCAKDCEAKPAPVPAPKR